MPELVPSRQGGPIKNRILEESPVKGYQLFRFQRQKADGTKMTLPNYYFRHRGKDTCTETDRLNEAKLVVKRATGEEARGRRRRTKPIAEPVTVGRLLDLVIEDYEANWHKR